VPTTLRMCKRHGHGWFIVFVNLCSTTKIRSCKKVASVVEWVVRESSFPHLQIVSKLCSANTHCVLPQFCLGQPFFSVCLLFGKFVVTPSQKLVFNPVSADQRYFFYLFPLCSRSDTSPCCRFVAVCGRMQLAVIQNPKQTQLVCESSPMCSN